MTSNIISDENRIRPKDSEVNRLYGDNTLMQELTGWKPEYVDIDGFKRGIEITAKWFTDKNNLSRYKPNNYAV